MSDSKTRVGIHHGRNPGGQAVVVAEPDLTGRHRVVLVDHRQSAVPQQRVQGVAGIQVAPPLLGVGQSQQDLRHGDAVMGERRLIGMGEADLAGRGGGLLVLQADRPSLGQAEMAAAQGDRAGGHHDDVLRPGP